MTVRPIAKRVARLACITVAVLAVAGALLWLLLSETRGPLVQGKPVAYWTRQLRHRHMDPDAIRALASDKDVAIPALVQQLSLPDLAASDFAMRLWLRLPAALQTRVSAPTTRALIRGDAASALVAIYEQPTGPTLSEAKMILPALTRALQDRDSFVRLNAAFALGHLRAVSAQAIESCDVAMKDPHGMVRLYAVYALGRLAMSDARAIPRLKSALADSNYQVRDGAAAQLEPLEIDPPRDPALVQQLSLPDSRVEVFANGLWTTLQERTNRSSK